MPLEHGPDGLPQGTSPPDNDLSEGLEVPEEPFRPGTAPRPGLSIEGFKIEHSSP